MRVPNDRILASKVGEIDLILGGHDHGYVVECDNKTGVFIVKSGSDFEDFSDIDLVFNIQSQKEADDIIRDKKSNSKYDWSEVKHLYSE